MSTDQLHAETERSEAVRPSLRRRLATSQGSLARFLRWGYRSINNFAVPAPKIIVKPLLWVFLLLRKAYYFAVRVFICEPLFKAYCTKYGRNLHTGCYLHWIVGRGDIVLGDNVTIDGKVSFAFAARFSDQPTLQIGDNTGIGHGCSFTVGKLISIGKNCNLSGDVTIMDSNAHDTDPVARWAHKPPNPEDVRPVIIRDGVWIGRQCIIFPGVKIGEGSVISAGSVVRSHVPPYSVVAGNPAKVMFRLKKPDQTLQSL
ncbi:MAG: acyltransferase [Terracidiphilus sp.]|jgi:acetyltransferase-like isoleucine patch superfamily enzyme